MRRCTEQTDEDFGGGMKQTWALGMKGIVSNQAEKIDKRTVTLRAQNGRMFSTSKGKREVLVEHYSEVRTVNKEHQKLQ